MKMLTAALLFCLCSVAALGQVHVRGNTTKKGTYRQSHVRSSPNSTKRDNYSTKGNVNPYTGKRGTKKVPN